MIKNFFKIVWRNLVKDKQFTFLNLVGLSTGLACVLLIYLWVNDERQVDKFHKNDKQLYRVLQFHDFGDHELSGDAIPAPAAKLLVEEMPEVEKAAVSTVDPGPDGIISVDNKHIKAKELLVTNKFFDIFSYQLLQGNRNNLFSNKYAVVMSDELAVKLFKTTENIIGKSIEWKRNDLSGSYIVSGIFEKPPPNSSVQFDLLFAYDYFRNNNASNPEDWGGSASNTYLVLKKGTDIDQFSKKINAFIKSRQSEWENPFFLQRYSEKYLYNQYEKGVATGGRIEYVRLFSIIAIFILIIACVNFMNLSTAKAGRRVKEVGIKKVIGASRKSLIVQYLGESMLMSFCALIIAVVLAALVLPQFNIITGKQLVLSFNKNAVLFFLVTVLLTGIIAGSYPALYISGFKPVAILKRKLPVSLGEQWIRKGLVVFQFALSSIFIIAVFVIYKQMQLTQTIDLGYKKDNIISFRKEGKVYEGYQAFMAEIKKIPGVANASSFENNMTGDHGGTFGVEWEDKKTGEQTSFGIMLVDYGLMEMLDLKMKEGRMFSPDFGGENSKIIFNEAAIQAMGIKDPVGKSVRLQMWNESKQIVGVVKDFHFESLYKKVKPCFFLLYPERQNILVKIKAGREKETITSLETFYKQYNLGLPLEYKFLDDEYHALYTAEQKVAILSRYFAGMAVIISCLGLFGLAAFTAQKRQKEIGIRKVIGARAKDISMMLSKDFLKLVMIAVLIAFPLSWWMMNQWLNDFAYRVNIGIDVFIIAGTAILFITVLTISFQALKAAIANPVTSLRTE